MKSAVIKMFSKSSKIAIELSYRILINWYDFNELAKQKETIDIKL